MKIEKWKYKDQEIEIPILEDEDIERNEILDKLEKTINLNEVLQEVGDIYE